MITMGMHYAGVSCMQGAINVLKKAIPCAVLLNDELVYEFTVAPLRQVGDDIHRVHQAHYHQVTLQRRGEYRLAVVADRFKCEKFVSIHDPLWVHFSYALYPNEHALKRNAGIVFGFHQAPQVFR